MADDTLLNDEDLLGVDGVDLLEDDLDESLLDDEIPVKKAVCFISKISILLY